MSRIYILLTVMVVMFGAPFFGTVVSVAEALEVIAGTSENDSLVGIEGADHLKGRAGDDHLGGGPAMT